MEVRRWSIARDPRGRRSTAVVAPRAAVAVLVLGGLLAACGTSSPAATSTPGRARSGTADVAFAGSLLEVNNVDVGPSFEQATGYSYSGRGAGSIGLAHDISSGEIAPSVFESVGAAPIQSLEPRFTRWYVEFAASPLVLAYNPHGPDAAIFSKVAKKELPLARVFEAMAAPGFLLGRTNPATDPQGQAFVMMVELAQRLLRLPRDIVTRILGAGATTGAGGTASQIYAETALDAHLEAGQLDAASAFLSQAVQLHLDYVSLPAEIDFGDPADAADYEAAHLVVRGASGAKEVLHGTPLVIDITSITEPAASAADVAAGNAFIAYQLSGAGRRAYGREGFELLKPTLFGPRSAVPTAIRLVLRPAG
jgi:molybdate/tungstate transport system substrate-binding protein